MINAPDARQGRDMMLLTADRIIAAEEMLSQADRDLGDGDHGLGMKRGMEAVKAKLEAMEPASVEEVFSAAGMAMMSSMGGASGALFGTVFRAGSKGLTGRPTLDSEGMALFLEAAVEGVRKRGGAEIGDKTMVDALAPAATAARESAALPLGEALSAIAAASEAGKEASRAMVAKFGRAKTLGEACIGFPDAGALSVTIILTAFRDYVSEAS